MSNDDQAFKLARDYLSLDRTLISGEEISMICRALVSVRSETADKAEGYPGIAHDLEMMRAVLLGASNLLRRCLLHGLLRAESEAMLLDIDAALKNAGHGDALLRDADRRLTPSSDGVACTCLGNAKQCEWSSCRISGECQYPSSVRPAERVARCEVWMGSSWQCSEPAWHGGDHCFNGTLLPRHPSDKPGCHGYDSHARNAPSALSATRLTTEAADCLQLALDNIGHDSELDGVACGRIETCIAALRAADSHRDGHG